MSAIAASFISNEARMTGRGKDMLSATTRVSDAIASTGSRYFHHRSSCRLCHSKDVEIVVPLAPIPIATPNVDLEAAKAKHAEVGGVAVPLDLYLCRACGHLQLLDVVDPEVQYRNFLYTTSISLGLPEHFQQLARDVLARIGTEGLVLEIGSNDGTLLRAFKEQGCRVLGIDPAQKIAERATAAGLPTLPLFFNAATAADIRGTHGTARAVICNNTFANLDDLDDVIAGIRAILAEDGIFVFETSYGADVVTNTLIDTVYHEHLSYFMVRPLERFFTAHGLDLFDVQRMWTKGGSLRGFVQHRGGARPRSAAVAAMIAEEQALGLDRDAPFRRFRDKLSNIRQTLAGYGEAARKSGRPFVGYGASVGSVTLIQQFGLAASMSFLVDDKPLGPELHLPGCALRIELPTALYEHKPEHVVILAWRYAGPIIAKHQKFLESGGKFVIPLPEIVLR
jgi:SAM-dependent methyltransferase